MNAAYSANCEEREGKAPWRKWRRRVRERKRMRRCSARRQVEQARERRRGSNNGKQQREATRARGNLDRARGVLALGGDNGVQSALLKLAVGATLPSDDDTPRVRAVADVLCAGRGRRKSWSSTSEQHPKRDLNPRMKATLRVLLPPLTLKTHRLIDGHTLPAPITISLSLLSFSLSVCLSLCLSLSLVRQPRAHTRTRTWADSELSSGTASESQGFFWASSSSAALFSMANVS